MSQLESILTQLKKSLAEPQASAAVIAQAPAGVDARAASMALKEFLSKTTVKSTQVTATEDPQLIVERRNALSAFVGLCLTNNGRAALPGIIDVDNNQIDSGEHGEKGSAPQPFSPDPDLPITPANMNLSKPIVATARAAEASSTLASTTATPSGMSMSSAASTVPSACTPQAFKHENDSPRTCRDCVARKEIERHAMAQPATNDGAPDKAPSSADKAAAANAAKDKAATKPANQAQKAGIASLFAAFGATAQSASKQAACPVERQAARQCIIWYKHIQAVESALRIGDLHFADSLLSLLFEVAESLAVELNITARLKSMQSRILIDRRQYKEAEKNLEGTISSLDGSPYSADISAAYCWRALAQCFSYQKNLEKAEKAREKSIAIANAALGDKDPEAMLFREPLAS